jgi:hypothetical protein
MFATFTLRSRRSIDEELVAGPDRCFPAELPQGVLEAGRLIEQLHDLENTAIIQLALHNPSAVDGTVVLGRGLICEQTVDKESAPGWFQCSARQGPELIEQNTGHMRKPESEEEEVVCLRRSPSEDVGEDIVNIWELYT